MVGQRDHQMGWRQ